MKSKLIPFLSFIVILTLNACKKDKIEPILPNEKYSNGAFISNEGAFGLGNSSISFLDFNTDVVTNDLFMEINNRPLGDVLQSMSLVNGKLYCVVNASNKIEIVNADDLTELGVIEGLENPRYVTERNGFLYVSEWGNNGQVKVIDSGSKSTVATINVGTGPEGIIAYDNLIWVANGGGYLVDSTVSVINPSSNSVIATISVGYNPKELTIDADGNIWVICSGYIEYDENWNVASESPSKLVKISTTGLEVTGEVEISQTSHPQHIDISKDKRTLYCGGGYGVAGIYAVNYTNPTSPQIIAGDKYFYGFNVNPENGDIYGLEAPSFTENGILCRYGASVNFIKQYEVGIGPNSVVFW